MPHSCTARATGSASGSSPRRSWPRCRPRRHPPSAEGGAPDAAAGSAALRRPPASSAARLEGLELRGTPAIAHPAAGIVLLDRLHPALHLRGIPERLVEPPADLARRGVLHPGGGTRPAPIAVRRLRDGLARGDLRRPVTLRLDLERLKPAGRHLDALVAHHPVLILLGLGAA